MAKTQALLGVVLFCMHLQVVHIIKTTYTRMNIYVIVCSLYIY